MPRQKKHAASTAKLSRDTLDEGELENRRRAATPGGRQGSEGSTTPAILEATKLEPEGGTDFDRQERAREGVGGLGWGGLTGSESPPDEEEEGDELLELVDNVPLAPCLLREVKDTGQGE